MARMRETSFVRSVLSEHRWSRELRIRYAATDNEPSKWKMGERKPDIKVGERSRPVRSREVCCGSIGFEKQSKNWELARNKRKRLVRQPDKSGNGRIILK
jgi:hypothetical protein